MSIKDILFNDTNDDLVDWVDYYNSNHPENQLEEKTSLEVFSCIQCYLRHFYPNMQWYYPEIPAAWAETVTNWMITNQTKLVWILSDIEKQITYVPQIHICVVLNKQVDDDTDAYAIWHEAMFTRLMNRGLLGLVHL